MDTLLWFINDNIFIISMLICLWFGYNCKKTGSYFNNFFEWGMFIIFISSMSYSLHCFSYDYLFRPWDI